MKIRSALACAASVLLLAGSTVTATANTQTISNECDYIVYSDGYTGINGYGTDTTGRIIMVILHNGHTHIRTMRTGTYGFYTSALRTGDARVFVNGTLCGAI